MNSRPTAVSQLFNRLIARPSANVQSFGPLIASATEMSDQPQRESSPLWVILHSITAADVRLIHPRPLTAKRLSVQFSADSGEILRVQLAATGSKKEGELYESTAAFLV